MANYVQTSVGSSTYDLAAVLIHRGPSAYSGHYVGKLSNIVEVRIFSLLLPIILRFSFLAHIKDQTSSSWFKFNDEVVQKLEGSEFQLGVEGDLEGNHIFTITVFIARCFLLRLNFVSR